MLDHLLLAANHHAVAALQAPHTAAGAHINVVNLSGREFLCAPNVVDVVGVSAVDEDVACFEMRQQVGDGLVDNRRRNHQPYRPRFLKLLDQIGQRICSRWHGPWPDRAPLVATCRTQRSVSSSISRRTMLAPMLPKSYHSELHKFSFSENRG